MEIGMWGGVSRLSKKKALPRLSFKGRGYFHASRAHPLNNNCTYISWYPVKNLLSRSGKPALDPLWPKPTPQQKIRRS